MNQRPRRVASPPSTRTGTPAWMRAEPIDHILLELARRCVAGSLVATLVACGPGDPLDEFAPNLSADGSGFEPPHCKGNAWDPMPYIEASATFDYAAFKIHYGGPSARLLSEHGVPCATASDANACASKLAALPTGYHSSDCIPTGCSARFVSTTLGDTVQQWTTREELLRFLGPIDSIEDALLLVAHDGYNVGHYVASESGAPFDCGTAAARAVAGGYEVYASRRGGSCERPFQITRSLLHVSAEGVVRQLKSAIALQRPYTACAGRRPEGLQLDDTPVCPSLGETLARHAQLEAASVFAFERMIAELHALGAPAELIAKARAARQDEMRHAEQVSALARRHGAQSRAVRVEPTAPRSVVQMAIENATEGCVRETWGALVGSYQAAHASNAEIAALFHDIAADERRHAALSWDLAAWLDTRLTQDERAEVQMAYHSAIGELRAATTWQEASPVVDLLGLPDVGTSMHLFQSMAERIWCAERDHSKA